MAVQLFDLAAADPAIRFSPFCWRTRMALAHKGLEVETVPWRFTDKHMIAFSRQERVPVIIDGDRVVVDSWTIAEYLDETYPDRPMLFSGDQSRAHGSFIRNWVERAVHPGIVRQIILPLFAMLAEKDKEYFRRSREQRFGCTLEQYSDAGEAGLAGFRNGLEPLRVTLSGQKFIGGATPSYADYIAFAAFQWARVSAPQDLLAPEDPVAAWRQSLLDMYDGLAASMPARAA